MSLLFLPYVFAGLAVLAGLAGNWWFDVTNWETAALFSATLIACVYVAQTDSPFARLAVTVIIGAALYLKGGIDKRDQLVFEHEADKLAIHNTYALAAKAEQDRQESVNAEALRAAVADKEARDAEISVLQQKLGTLAVEAQLDPRAEAPSLSHDAVKRLNSLRVRRGS